MERILSLESGVGTLSLAEESKENGANLIQRHTLTEQVEALKATLEIHKETVADVVGLERKARENALDVQTSITQRLQEDMVKEDSRNPLR